MSNSVEDHEAGMDAARQVAQWYLGDPGWAGWIVSAYNNPKRALRLLEEDKAS